MWRYRREPPEHHQGNDDDDVDVKDNVLIRGDQMIECNDKEAALIRVQGLGKQCNVRDKTYIHTYRRSLTISTPVGSVQVPVTSAVRKKNCGLL